jgi:hypothetical protein
VRPMAAPQVARDDRATRVLVVIALVIALLTDFGYVLIIRSQDASPPDRVVPFVAAYLASMAAMLGVSLWDWAPALRARPALRAGAAGGLIVLGILGLWSIGLPLVAAAGLAIAATARTASPGPTRSGVPVKLAAAAAAVVILVAGYEVSSRLIQCQSQGEMGGTGGLVLRFSWDCVNGHVEFH